MTNLELGVICTVATTVVGALSYSFGVSKNESGKRARIYERLDEHKDHIDGSFVRKDICEERTKRIEEKIDKLLEKNGIGH